MVFFMFMVVSEVDTSDDSDENRIIRKEYKSMSYELIAIFTLILIEKD